MLHLHHLEFEGNVIENTSLEQFLLVGLKLVVFKISVGKPINGRFIAYLGRTGKIGAHRRCLLVFLQIYRDLNWRDPPV